MEYLINATSEIKSQEEIRKLHPQVSLPRVWTESTCDSLGITPILETPKPQPSTMYKNVVRDGVTTDANGNTVQAWKEVNMFSDYTDENNVLVTQAEQEQQYYNTKLQERKDQECKIIDTNTKETIIGLVGSVEKQSTLQAIYSDLLNKKVDGTITAEETTQMDNMKVLWDSVKALIDAGNTKEQSIQDALTFEDVDTIINS